MEIALDPAKAVKEYKEQIKDLEKKVDKYAKTVGKLTVERDWAVGKLKSFIMFPEKTTKTKKVFIPKC